MLAWLAQHLSAGAAGKVRFVACSLVAVVACSALCVMLGGMQQQQRQQAWQHWQVEACAELFGADAVGKVRRIYPFLVGCGSLQHVVDKEFVACCALWGCSSGRCGGTGKEEAGTEAMQWARCGLWFVANLLMAVAPCSALCVVPRGNAAAAAAVRTVRLEGVRVCSSNSTVQRISSMLAWLAVAVPAPHSLLLLLLLLLPLRPLLARRSC